MPGKFRNPGSLGDAPAPKNPSQIRVKIFIGQRHRGSSGIRMYSEYPYSVKSTAAGKTLAKAFCRSRPSHLSGRVGSNSHRSITSLQQAGVNRLSRGPERKVPPLQPLCSEGPSQISLLGLSGGMAKDGAQRWETGGETGAEPIHLSCVKLTGFHFELASECAPVSKPHYLRHFVHLTSPGRSPAASSGSFLKTFQGSALTASS